VYYGTRGAVGAGLAFAGTAAALMMAELAAGEGLYWVGKHAAQRIAERGIFPFIIRTTVRYGARCMNYQAKQTILKNIVNFLTTATYRAAGTYGTSEGVYIVIRNLFTGKIRVASR
jgi:hypothetical protein